MIYLLLYFVPGIALAVLATIALLIKYSLGDRTVRPHIALVGIPSLIIFWPICSYAAIKNQYCTKHLIEKFENENKI